MSIVNIPGFSGYVLDTSNGGIARVGSSGGFRHPMTGALNQWGRFDEVGGGLGTAAYQMLSQMGAFGGQGGGAADELMQLQIDAINRANAAQDEIMARENARRNAYNRWVKGERWTPTNMEEEQGQLAARSGAISAQEQDRLEKALKGNLPVSESTTREISDNKAVLNERLRRNLGPGYETSEPGAQALARFDESSSMLEEGDRKAYIERGIQPSITAAQFAQDAVGQYVPPESQGLAAALRGMMQMQLGREQIGASQASDYIKSRQGNKTSGWGGGFGNFIGSIGGPLANYFTNSFFEQPRSGGSTQSRSYSQTRRNASTPSDYYGGGGGFD